MDLGVLRPSEIRRGLAQEGEFVVEELIGAEDLQGEDLWGSEELPTDPVLPGNVSSGEIGERCTADSGTDYGSVGVIVLKDGEVLTGCRTDNRLIGGPGGHIEAGENPKQAAIRETFEEFGIRPTTLKYLGQLDGLEAKYGKPHIFLCTDFAGKPKCKSDEMIDPAWIRPDNLVRDCFPPFLASLELLERVNNLNPKKALVSGGKGGKGGKGGEKKPENSAGPLTVDTLRDIVLDAEGDQLRDENGQFASSGAGGTGKSDKKPFPKGVLTSKDVVKFLKSEGFVKDRQKGSHATYKKEGRSVQVPDYGNESLGKDLIKSIREQAGYDKP
jgi:8-oxo-dGTP pyrophosphatase MutT (NUDIX family)/predicted RNA binding protein YcfA (HicA-like mRNA interferase family)